MARTVILGYIERDTLIHRLTGLSKLIGFLLWSVAAMISFDTRMLALLVAISLWLFGMSKIRFKEIAHVFYFILFLMVINAIFIFIFSPEEGVKIYGTRTVLHQLTDNYAITSEQLFYQATVVLKYFTIVPIALLFILTTQPNEFAASLNAIFVPYSIAYSVAIALRYIPDVQRDYRNISRAQQARGVDMSKKANAFKRLRNIASIILPLVLASIDRINSISNAMELRGFGKKPKRTWYSARPFKRRDAIAVASCALLIAFVLVVTWTNGSRFYNPFA
ncbi:MAG: energy-coupling factor transporter transmembrane protein EcfT [Oscillospiraceae bacterium]|nr:energy-coupling factor transporter transmembrane protein EcfT [Oscillospiraceae bacterium]